IALPFALGFALGMWMHQALALTGSRINFALFMATAMSITAIPVLGRILVELNLTRTKIGSLAISAAAVNDAVGWVLLAGVTAVVRSTLDPVKLALMIVETVGFAAVMMLGVRPLLKRWTAAVMRKDRGKLSLNSLATLLILIFLAAIATN